MATNIEARNTGGGDPFADPRVQGMHREINLLRAGNEAAQMTASIIRRNRLELLQDEVDRNAKRARKRNKQARDAIALTDPSQTTVTQAAQHQALVALQASNKAERRVNEAQSELDRAMAEGETWHAIDSGVELADELGVADGAVSGEGLGTAVAAGALGLGAAGLLSAGSSRPRRRRRW